MGQEAIRTILAIVTAFVGLAILSVILSKNSKTLGVIQNTASGIALDTEAATAPVTGASNLQVSFASN